MSKYPESMRSAIEETIREKIRLAGIELLREQGQEGFTTEKIAEKIGLSRGVLYHYFANKEAIASFIIVKAWEEQFRRLEAVADGGGSAAGRLTAVAEQSVSEVLAQRAVHRVLMAHLPPPGENHAIVLDFHRRREALFRRIVEEGIRAGEFGQVEPDDAVCAYIGILHELCLHALFHGVPPRTAETVQIFLRGIRP